MHFGQIMALRESVKWVPKLEDDIVFKMDSARVLQTILRPPRDAKLVKETMVFRPDLLTADKYPKPFLNSFALGRRESIQCI